MENYPVFLLSGLFPWIFLRNSLHDAANSIMADRNLIKKIYFPYEILPIAKIAANFINFFFSLIIMLILSLALCKPSLPSILFWLPLTVFIQIILIVGISLFFTGLNTIYREAQFIIEILLLVWFYATPIVYPLEMAEKMLSSRLLILYRLNPMNGIISAYQNLFLRGSAPDMGPLLFSAAVAIIFFNLGFSSFRRHEEIFVDIV